MLYDDRTTIHLSYNLTAALNTHFGRMFNNYFLFIIILLTFFKRILTADVSTSLSKCYGTFYFYIKVNGSLTRADLVTFLWLKPELNAVTLR